MVHILNETEEYDPEDDMEEGRGGSNLLLREKLNYEIYFMEGMYYRILINEWSDHSERDVKDRI